MGQPQATYTERVDMNPPLHTKKNELTVVRSSVKEKKKSPSGSLPTPLTPQECLEVGGSGRGWEREGAGLCACQCAQGKETQQADTISCFQSKAPIKHKADVSK